MRARDSVYPLKRNRGDSEVAAQERGQRNALEAALASAADWLRHSVVRTGPASEDYSIQTLKTIALAVALAIGFAIMTEAAKREQCT